MRDKERIPTCRLSESAHRQTCVSVGILHCKQVKQASANAIRTVRSAAVGVCKVRD